MIAKILIILLVLMAGFFIGDYSSDNTTEDISELKERIETTLDARLENVLQTSELNGASGERGYS